MSRKWMFAGLAALMLILIWGCEKSPTGTEATTDKEAIEQMMFDNVGGYFSFDDHYGADDTTATKGTKGIKEYAFAIWWRWPSSWVRDITIHIENDSAYVTYTGAVTGIFHLMVDSVPPLDTLIDHPKDLEDTFTRYAIFRRYADSVEAGYRGWRLEKITGVEVTSKDHTVDIDSVRVQSTSYPDTVITDPLVFVDRESIFTFGPEEEVTLTVYSPDSIYAFLHARGCFGGNCHWWRWRFNASNTGTWTTPHHEGVRVAAFDILHKNTIDNIDYIYDSNAWIFPYMVVAK